MSNIDRPFYLPRWRWHSSFVQSGVFWWLLMCNTVALARATAMGCRHTFMWAQLLVQASRATCLILHGR